MRKFFGVLFASIVLLCGGFVLTACKTDITDDTNDTGSKYVFIDNPDIIGTWRAEIEFGDDGYHFITFIINQDETFEFIQHYEDGFDASGAIGLWSIQNDIITFDYTDVWVSNDPRTEALKIKYSDSWHLQDGKYWRNIDIFYLHEVIGTMQFGITEHDELVFIRTNTQDIILERII